MLNVPACLQALHLRWQPLLLNLSRGKRCFDPAEITYLLQWLIGPILETVYGLSVRLQWVRMMGPHDRHAGDDLACQRPLSTQPCQHLRGTASTVRSDAVIMLVALAKMLWGRSASHEWGSERMHRRDASYGRNFCPKHRGANEW